MTDITITAVATAIIDGEFDENLDILSDAIKQRKQRHNQLKKLLIRKDDTVVLLDIRPKYLVGLTAKTVRVNDKSVTVDFPNKPEYGRFAGAKSVRCPINTVEKVAPVETAPTVDVPAMQAAAAEQGTSLAGALLGD